MKKYYVGGRRSPQIVRWFLWRSPVDAAKWQGRPVQWWHKWLDFNVCVHKWLHEDPEGLHDHPWWNVTIVLKGTLYEDRKDAVGRMLQPGNVVFRKATDAHRVMPVTKVAWTLFVTGPERREWGYWLHGKWKRA
jgi:hypothetical protein